MYAELTLQSHRFVLFHYPIAEWARIFKGSIHVHGHVHNRPTVSAWDSSKLRAVNVGVDVNNFTPVSIDEVIRRVAKIPTPKRERDLDDE